MAYGDSQYSSAPLQFGNLSPIVEAALQRRKQQQQQQAQMLQAMAKMASQPRQQPSVATPPSNLNMSDAMAGAPPVDITSSDPAQLRITAYGPNISNPSSADYNETIGSHDNVLQPGDVAVSPDLRSRFPIGSRIRIGNDGQPYTVNDFTNPRLHNRVDIWNGQDMGTQPVYGYAGGGVVPRPMQHFDDGGVAIRRNPYGNSDILPGVDIEDLATVPTSLGESERRRLLEELRLSIPQYPPRQPQHFASGGVASFTDPYGERKSQYAEHLGPMADVTGIVGVIARQRQFQQELQQEQMKQAYDQATKLMEQRRTDAIGQAMIQNNPEIAKDPRTQAYVAAGAHPLDAFKMVDQQRTDEADTNRQATNDYWNQHDRQSLVNYRQGLDEWGQPLPAGTRTQNGKEWAQAPDGTWHMVTGNVAFNNAQGPDVPNAQQNLQNLIGVKTADLPTAAAALNAYVPNTTEFPKVGVYQQGNQTPGPQKDKILSAFREYQTGQATPGLPNPQTAQPAPAPQQTMPEQRFGSEGDARAAGHKSGDTVMLFDPDSKRYRPATLN